MSDTDKTRPEWVQVKDPTNRGWLEESHRHEKGICDIQDYDERGGMTWRNRWLNPRCGMWTSRLAHKEGIYPRRKSVKYYTYAEVRRERAQWRENKDRIRKGDLDAADESPRSHYSHRHSALWLAY